MEEFDDKEISALLRLKRYEKPPPAYFEDFLHEFHRRQRDELLRQPLWQIAFQRVQDFMLTLSVARLASYPAAVTAVLVCAAVVSLKVYQAPLAQTKVAQVAPALPAENISDNSWSLAQPLSTRVSNVPPQIHHSHLSTQQPATPPRYVLDRMPVSYESSLRF